MSWAFVWMMVALKIPLAMLLWLVWWAIKEPDPDGDEERSDDRGGSDRDPHPRRRGPRPPRRGPHAEPQPRPPKRVRAAGRPLAPTRR